MRPMNSPRGPATFPLGRTRAMISISSFKTVACGVRQPKESPLLLTGVPSVSIIPTTFPIQSSKGPSSTSEPTGLPFRSKITRVDVILPTSLLSLITEPSVLTRPKTRHPDPTAIPVRIVRLTMRLLLSTTKPPASALPIIVPSAFTTRPSGKTTPSASPVPLPTPPCGTKDPETLPSKSTIVPSGFKYPIRFPVSSTTRASDSTLPTTSPLRS